MRTDSRATSERAIARTLGSLALTLLIVGVATGLQWLLWPVLAPAPYVFYYPSVIVAAYLGGAGAGALAIAIEMFVAAWLFDASPDSPEFAWQQGMLRQVLFALSAGMMAWITAAMRRSREELQQAVRARDEFLSMASHELKTPLSSMQLQVEMTKRSLSRSGEEVAFAPDRVRRLVEQTDRQITRLNRLVDDMLDIARIATGRLSLNLQPTNLAEVAQEMVERLQPLLEEAGCNVSVQVDDAPSGRWDRFRLEQVLANLLTNAARYGARQPVLVVVRKRHAWAELVVRDQGRGIAPEDRERIFERFERAVTPSEVSGLGLGLFISKEIVEMHHGTIRVESTPGKGSTFTVSLPLLEQVATHAV